MERSCNPSSKTCSFECRLMQQMTRLGVTAFGAVPYLNLVINTAALSRAALDLERTRCFMVDKPKVFSGVETDLSLVVTVSTVSVVFIEVFLKNEVQALEQAYSLPQGRYRFVAAFINVVAAELWEHLQTRKVREIVKDGVLLSSPFSKFSFFMGKLSLYSVPFWGVVRYNQHQLLNSELGTTFSIQPYHQINKAAVVTALALQVAFLVTALMGVFCFSGLLDEPVKGGVAGFAAVWLVSLKP